MKYLPMFQEAGQRWGKVDKDKFFSYHIEEIFYKIELE